MQLCTYKISHKKITVMFQIYFVIQIIHIDIV